MRERAPGPTDSGTRAAPATRPAAAPQVERILALQRTAGNRAVAAAVEETPKGHYADVPGIGKIPVESVSWGGSNVATTADVSLWSQPGKHSPLLMRAAVEGGPMNVEIVMQKDGKPFLRIKLTNALISSYQLGGGREPLEAWSLVPESMDVEHVPR